jgi:hypothetical protein
VDIPVKLPAPDAGTAEQPEPKSIAEVELVPAEADIDDEAAEVGVAAAAAGLELLAPLPHAAAPSAIPAVATETARVR